MSHFNKYSCLCIVKVRTQARTKPGLKLDKSRLHIHRLRFLSTKTL